MADVKAAEESLVCREGWDADLYLVTTGRDVRDMRADMQQRAGKAVRGALHYSRVSVQKHPVFPSS